MNKVDVKSLKLNPFTAIGEDWLLLTAGNKDNANTMTASWGGMGVLWGKNVVTVYVRPQRFTYQFMETPTTLPSPSSTRAGAAP